MEEARVTQRALRAQKKNEGRNETKTVMACLLMRPPLKLSSKRDSSTAQDDAFARAKAKEKIGLRRSE